MPLNSTPGDPGANSFLSLIRAEQIALERLHTETWDAASDTDKEKSLIMATRLISTRICYKGSPASGSQSLPFPRVGSGEDILLGSNGAVISSTAIPIEIELATFDLAQLLLTSDITLDSDISTLGISRIKAGPVDLSFRDATSTSGSKTLPGNVLSYIPSSWICEDLTGTTNFEFSVY